MWSFSLKTITLISLVGLVITSGFVNFVFLKRGASHTVNITTKLSLQTNFSDDAEEVVVTKDLYKAGFRRIGKFVCSRSPEHLLLLVIVISSAGNVRERMTVRKTWGHCQLRNDVSLGFLIGYDDSHDLSKEIEFYDDIIISKNEDCLNNTVLQSISMLEYVSGTCPRAPYVLKTQDDTYINLPILLSLIDYQIKRGGIYGNLQQNVKVSRDKTSGNYVPQGVLPGETLPDFVSGNTYIFSGDKADGLFATSLEVPYLPLEGVFITGLVAEELNIKRHHVHEFRRADGKPPKKTEVSYLIALPFIHEDRFYKIWQILSNRLMDY